MIWLREINTFFFLGFWHVTLEQVLFQHLLVYWSQDSGIFSKIFSYMSPLWHNFLFWNWEHYVLRGILRSLQLFCCLGFMQKMSIKKWTLYVVFKHFFFQSFRSVMLWSCLLYSVNIDMVKVNKHFFIFRFFICRQ